MRGGGRALAIVNYDLRASGTVMKSLQIAAAARAAGLPAELWFARPEGALAGALPPGVPVFGYGGRARAGGRGRDLALNVPRLAAMLRERTPALLLSGGNHHHLPARLALALTPSAARPRYGVRVSNSSQRSRRDSPVAIAGARLKLGHADFAVAVSDELADEVRRSRAVPFVHSIPNGVDVATIARRCAAPFAHPFLDDDNARARMPVIVSMGRLSRQKGFDVLIRALALLPPALPARLLVVGDGPRRIREPLIALAAQHGVAERIDFLGFRANPFAIMARCDLFVAASRWEGASNALLEALACGLPLVATDCPTGNREIVRDGAYGTLAPPRDPHALAAAIVAELAVRRSREAQRDGAARRSLEACMAAWTDLLDGQAALAAR